MTAKWNRYPDQLQLCADSSVSPGVCSKMGSCETSDAPSHRAQLRVALGSGVSWPCIRLGSVPSVLAALLAASMTTHHAQPEPHQRPEQRSNDGVQPQRPGEAHEQEVELDVLGVLENEDEQHPDAGERSDRPTAQPTSTLLWCT